VQVFFNEKNQKQMLPWRRWNSEEILHM